MSFPLVHGEGIIVLCQRGEYEVLSIYPMRSFRQELTRGLTPEDIGLGGGDEEISGIGLHGLAAML